MHEVLPGVGRAGLQAFKRLKAWAGVGSDLQTRNCWCIQWSLHLKKDSTVQENSQIDKKMLINLVATNVE